MTEAKARFRKSELEDTGPDDVCVIMDDDVPIGVTTAHPTQCGYRELPRRTFVRYWHPRHVVAAKEVPIVSVRRRK